jgi:hypothetical protein
LRPVLDHVRGALGRWRRVSVGEARRYNVAKQERWRPRAEAAVDMWLADGPQRSRAESPLRVADFGAGNEVVGRLLAERAPYPIQYAAYDLHPQQPSTTRLDVRDGLPAGTVDVAFALGLIEYLPDTDPILERLAAHARHLVVSYVEFDEARKPVVERAALGWVRHQTGTELDQALARTHLVELARRTTDAGETSLRLLRSSGHRPADPSSA